MPQLLVIGNPDNRRIQMLADAAGKLGWKLNVVSYSDLLREKAEAWTKIERAKMVRIESPGECFEVERLLLAGGASAAEAEGGPVLTEENAQQLRNEPGRILNPRQNFLGFASILKRLQRSTHIRWMNSPASILSMFDKPATWKLMTAAGVAMPLAAGRVLSFDHLMLQMNTLHWDRAIVKLANSSSASGIAAISRQRNNIYALSTVDIDGPPDDRRIYNSLKIKRYSGFSAVSELVKLLIPHHLVLEKWLPKAAASERATFDLRVVVVGGQPTHHVVRTSRSPFTNLHLGNRRGDWQETQQQMCEASREDLHKLCVRAAQSLPGALYAGLDVLPSPGFRKFYLIEANAFGDLLPNVFDSQGRDTYLAELQAFETSPL